MGKITVGQIINANSTDPWLTIAQKFVTAAGTAAISKIPQLSGMMVIFGSAMRIYAGVLKVLGVYEKIVPIINLAVKLNDVLTLNFATIAELVQDVLSMLGGLAIAFANAGLMALKEFILNFPFYFPDVPPDKITAITNKVQDTKKVLKDSFKTNLKKIDTKKVVTKSKKIDAKADTLTQAFDDLDALINAHIAALTYTIQTPAQWKNEILALTLNDLITSTLPTGIEETDAEIYEYIILQIDNLINKISQIQKEEMEKVTINISEDTAGLSPTAVASMNKLTTIYLDMAKQAEIFYKEQVFRLTTYKENNDIKILIKSFKEYMVKEIEKKKKKYYNDMQKIVVTPTDIETIRTLAISIVFEPIDWYNIFDIAVMRVIMQSIITDNEEADLYDTNSSLAAISGSLNDDLMNAAANIFNNSVSAIAAFISDSLIPIPGRGLEPGQLQVNGLDTCVDDTLSGLIDFIDMMGAFNLNDILNALRDIINDLVIAASINEGIPDIDSLCQKLNEIKNGLFNSVNETLLEEVIKNYFKNFNVSYGDITLEDKMLIRNYILKSLELYANNIMSIANDAIHKGNVPCRNCVSCAGLKEALLSAMNTIKIPNLKYSMNKALEEGISALPFTGNSTTDKALVIAYLEAPSTVAMLNNIRNATINENMMNMLLERIFKDQQFMMIDAIRKKMGL